MGPTEEKRPGTCAHAGPGAVDSPLLCRLHPSLRHEQHAVLFLVHDWNLGWGDGLVGLGRDVAPLWGFSRPGIVTYKVSDCPLGPPTNHPKQFETGSFIMSSRRKE